MNYPCCFSICFLFPNPTLLFRDVTPNYTFCENIKNLMSLKMFVQKMELKAFLNCRRESSREEKFLSNEGEKEEFRAIESIWNTRKFLQCGFLPLPYYIKQMKKLNISKTKRGKIPFRSCTFYCSNFSAASSFSNTLEVNLRSGMLCYFFRAVRFSPCTHKITRELNPFQQHRGEMRGRKFSPNKNPRSQQRITFPKCQLLLQN